MSEPDIDAVNQDFSRLYANSKPIRTKDELDAAIRAAGLPYEGVSEEFLRSLRKDWVFLESEQPFEDDRQNKAYRRELLR